MSLTIKHRISIILSLIAVLGLIIFGVALLTSVFNNLGWDAPVNIGLTGMVVAWALSVGSILFWKKNPVGWICLVIGTIIIIFLFYIIINFHL